MKFIKNWPYYALFFLFSITPLIGRNRQDFLRLYEQSVGTSLPQQTSSTASYYFTIDTATDLNGLGWRAYYQGRIIPQKGTVFQFSAEKDLETIGIIIAMLKRPEKATIEALEVPKGIDYTYYKLTKRPLLADAKKRGWSIEQISGNQGFIIPENTVVILLDPKYVKTLKRYSWGQESDIIMLPSIVLEPIETLHETSVKTMLAALDTDVFHSREETEQTLSV